MMEEFEPYKRVVPSQDVITRAALRYEIHTAVAAIQSEDDLRAILSRVRRMKPQREEFDDE
jgi:hypothetical protein